MHSRTSCKKLYCSYHLYKFSAIRFHRMIFQSTGWQAYQQIRTRSLQVCYFFSQSLRNLIFYHHYFAFSMAMFHLVPRSLCTTLNPSDTTSTTPVPSGPVVSMQRQQCPDQGQEFILLNAGPPWCIWEILVTTFAIFMQTVYKTLISTRVSCWCKDVNIFRLYRRSKANHSHHQSDKWRVRHFLFM